jgi:hypothetical protein
MLLPSLLLCAVLAAINRGNWRQNCDFAGDILRQIRCRFLLAFAAQFCAVLLLNDFVRRWCLVANQASNCFIPASHGGWQQCWKLRLHLVSRPRWHFTKYAGWLRVKHSAEPETQLCGALVT